ncbi:hypothetical protein BD289DRAFT_438369 [Coniella lustricola]|uniref:Enoyl reductase (ER) domain-containing protein n=1 Tax=Coniella lustricola TaxID=2025994 RepID=A0A2T3A313_9PEZI|nr:hypothetical protein BD289DRAFT_438369 [Coniella lustricola]
MPSTPSTARAIITHSPGIPSPSTLSLESIPVPVPKAGQVLLRVLGFGINRAEMYTRQGLSPGLSFPLTLGIECVGRVVGFAPNDDAITTATTKTTKTTKTKQFRHNDLVATCMGGLGRQIPGSYQEYTCVPAANLRHIHIPTPPSTNNASPLQTQRPSPPPQISTAVLAALPEMLQTTWGALASGLAVVPHESVLVRGGTSSIGLCAIQLLKKKFGASRVGATTRSADRVEMLRAAGADVVFIDGEDGKIAGQVMAGSGAAVHARDSKEGSAKQKRKEKEKEESKHEGEAEQQDLRFDKCLELIGTTTFLDSAACLKPGGTVCMVGMQGGQWELTNFSPFMIPNRVRVCAYGGSTQDFFAMPWDELVLDVIERRIVVPVREYAMEDIQKVHEIMEAGGGGAKMVVVLGEL